MLSKQQSAFESVRRQELRIYAMFISSVKNNKGFSHRKIVRAILTSSDYSTLPHIEECGTN